MLTLEQVIKRLKDYNLSAVSRATGISRQALYDLMSGSKPMYETVRKLSDYLEGK